MSKHYANNPTGDKIPNFQQFTCIHVNFKFVTSLTTSSYFKALNFTFTFFFSIK